MSDKKHEVVAKTDVVPSREVLHPAVSKILDQNPTPEALEKILQLQREWEAGEAKRAYTSAIVGLRADLPNYLKRDKQVAFDTSKGKVRYSHTTLAAAMDAVVPILTKHGFSLSWEPSTSGTNVTVKAVLTHRDGHSESCQISSAADNSGLKSAPQAVASTITLLQRYSLLSLLGIATADMEEPGPVSEGDVTRVNTEMNLKAVAAIKKAGRTKEQAEEYVGRFAEEWTSSDLDLLRAWLKEKK